MSTIADMDAELDKFVQVYRDLLRDSEPSGDQMVEEERRIFLDLLEDIDAPFEARIPQEKPVCRFLDTLGANCKSAQDREILSKVLPMAGQAYWMNLYRQLPERRTLFDNFAFCDFIGPHGWRDNDRVTLGLTMLGPNTEYPFHEHPARELYYLLSGTSSWAVDNGSFQERGPGSWILHTEMQPHSMKSGTEPLLAISVWRGEIHSRSRFSKFIAEEKKHV